MSINPKNALQSFATFRDELINVANQEYEEYKKNKKVWYANKSTKDYQHKLFNLEDKYFLLTYIFSAHNIDDKTVIETVKSGKFTYEENDRDFLQINPNLLFYRYILLKDKDRKYNIGYFTENIRTMMKTLIELNLFFLDAYILCKVMNEVFNWKRLTPEEHPETKPVSVRFNNILMIGYRYGKPYLTVNEDGMSTFKSYNTGKISVGLYSGDDLLYCRKISVPIFSQEGDDVNRNQDVREAIFKSVIGEDRKVRWGQLLPHPGLVIKDYPSIYKEVTDWLLMTGLLLDFSNTDN